MVLFEYNLTSYPSGNCGLICFVEYLAATFGRNGMSPSYAQFDIPDSISDELAHHVSVSFLVRTRQQSGLIFFVGSDTSVAATNQTFIMIELSEHGVVSKIKLGDEVERHVLQGLVADGNQHIIHVSRNYSLLQIQLDNMSKTYTVDYSLPLIPNLLYVGGMPSHNLRHRRDASSYSSGQFAGTLQDVRLNDMRLSLFHINTTDEDGTPAPRIRLPRDLRNVDAGEQSDDVCELQQPCENNATCQTEFFNKYRFSTSIYSSSVTEIVKHLTV